MDEGLQKTEHGDRRRSLRSDLVALFVLAILFVAAAMPPSRRELQLVVLAALLGAVGITGWRLACVLMPRANATSRGVCALTVAIAIVTVPATVLGHFGQLRLSPFLVLVGACLGGSLLLRMPEKRPRENDPGEQPIGAVELALIVAATAALTLRLGGSAEHAIREPAAYLGYDDLSYHLPAAALFHRYADLRTLKFEIGDPSTTFYPLVGELSSWALLAPLGDSDFFARRVQFPFAFGSLIAVAALARRCGLRRSTAMTAGLLYATVDSAFPVLALGAGNDHAASFLTLAGLDGAIELAERRSVPAAVVPGIALGLLVGTKYLGLLFGAVVLAFLGALLLLAVGKRESTAAVPLPAGGGLPVAGLPTGLHVLQAVVVLVLTILVCGGYAYARNAWTAHNPLYPEPLRLFGHQLAAGLSAASLAWRQQRPESRIQLVSFLVQQPAVLGWPFVWTMLPGAVAAPLVAMIRRQWRESLLFAVPLLLFVEFRFLIGDHRGIRYLLPALAVAAIAALWLATTLHSRWSPVLRCLLLAGILVAAVGHLKQALLPLGLVIATLLALGAGATALRRWFADAQNGARWVTGRNRSLVAVAVTAALAAGVLLGARAIDRFQDAKTRGNGAGATLEALTGAGAATVAFVGLNQPYDFFGSRLQHDVHLVPTDGGLDEEYYEWGGSARFPFSGGTEERWRAGLAARGVRWVVAIPNGGEGPERGWMLASRDEFSLVERSGNVEIWRFAKRPT